MSTFYKLEITQIHCHSKGGSAPHDDVMILVQVDAGPPVRYPIFGAHSMKSGDNWQPGSVYYFQTTAYISIWDRDGAMNFCDASDMLGSFWVKGDIGENAVTVRGDQGANYTIYYNIIEEQLPAANGGTGLEATLVQAISDDLLAWSQTTQGRTAIATSDPSTLQGLLKDALLSTAFSRVGDEIKKELKIKGISLGVMAQADIFIGIEGAFGVALNAADFKFVGVNSDPDQVTASIFAGAGFVEGVEEGIQGTLAIGIWFESVGDIGGIYVGEEMDVDDGVGVTAVAFAGREDKDDMKDEEGALIVEKLKVIFVGIDVGIDDGVEEDELYFFSGVMSRKPVSQSGDYDHIAVLDDLHCHNALSASANAKDHVYIEYTVDDDDTVYRYPIWNTIEMSENNLDHWYCGNAIKFNEKFIVTLKVGTTGEEYSQRTVESREYTIEQFNSSHNVDHSFENNEGIHKIEYHLHAILQS